MVVISTCSKEAYLVEKPLGCVCPFSQDRDKPWRAGCLFLSFFPDGHYIIGRGRVQGEGMEKGWCHRVCQALYPSASTQCEGSTRYLSVKNKKTKNGAGFCVFNLHPGTDMWHSVAHASAHSPLSHACCPVCPLIELWVHSLTHVYADVYHHACTLAAHLHAISHRAYCLLLQPIILLHKHKQSSRLSWRWHYSVVKKIYVWFKIL